MEVKVRLTVTITSDKPCIVTIAIFEGMLSPREECGNKICLKVWCCKHTLPFALEVTPDEKEVHELSVSKEAWILFGCQPYTSESIRSGMECISQRLKKQGLSLVGNITQEN